MIEIGFKLTCEEQSPSELIDNARLAEEAGFPFVFISDHFHPWTTTQGSSPFVWGILGGIAAVTRKITVGTAVTCPIGRMHPAIVAHAAATAAVLLNRPFILGVGTGEYLNEHVTGEAWPAPAVRLAMLDEAIVVIKRLFSGSLTSYRGSFFTLDRAQLFNVPEQPAEIMVAASGPRAAALAARRGDALVNLEPDSAVVEKYRADGGNGSCYGQLKICWADDEQVALQTVRRTWPNLVLPKAAKLDLPLPTDFDQLGEVVSDDLVEKAVVCGPDPERYVEAIRQYEKAGYTHVYLHQIGHDQRGFVNFFRTELAPRL